MSTPSRFFNECVDLEGGSTFADDFGNGDAPESGYSNNFPAYDDVFGLSTGIPNANKAPRNAYQEPAEGWNGTRGPQRGMNVQFEQTPYGGPYEHPLDLNVGDDSAATGPEGSSNTSTTTPDTGGSTRTTSTAGSQGGSSSGSKTHNYKSPVSVESPADLLPTRKRKGGRKSIKANPTVAEEEVKRNKFLERNRIAASKCRQKKKEWVSDLEDQKAGLESRHSHLQMEYNGLLGEVSGLKEELMAHANCNDPNIDQWLENEARKFVQETSEKLYSGNRGGNNGGPGRQGSMSSGFPGTGCNVDPMLRGGTSGSSTNGGNGANAFGQGSIITTTSQGNTIPVSPMQASPTAITFHQNGDREVGYGQMSSSMYDEDHQHLDGG